MFQKIYRSMCLLTILTLSLAIVFMLSAFYVCLTQQVKSELVTETRLIYELADTGGDLSGHTFENQFAVFSAGGQKVYGSDLPISAEKIRANILHGNNDFSVYSTFHLENFSKTYYCMTYLSDGNVLCVASTRHNLPVLFGGILFVAVLAAVFISIVAANVARAITNNIIAPFREAALMNFADTDSMYEEIKPLIAKLTNQDTEIKRQSDKAKSQKLQLQTVTSNMNEGLVILDSTGNILAMNRCAQEILNADERDVKYKPFLSIPNSGQFEQHLKEASQGKNNDVLFEASGKTYQMFFTPVFEQNIVCGMVILMFDVSEKHRSEQIRREFSANVSHELKTPLTTIFGYSQIITNGIAKPEDVKGFAAKIEKESARLITLIDDIIALSNLEENGSAAQKENVSLKAVAAEVLESLEAQAAKRNISLILAGSNTQVVANRRQMHELIFNLCDNALKYNKDGGSVTVTLSNNMLCVADTGIGIPPDSIDRLFERFYRVDKSHSKKVNGTGLGLSIVKHIVQSSGAEISVKSTLGEGSAFTVVFRPQ